MSFVWTQTHIGMNVKAMESYNVQVYIVLVSMATASLKHPLNYLAQVHTPFG